MSVYNIDDEIKACEQKMNDDEIIVFGVGVGRIMSGPCMTRKYRRAMKEAIEYIKNFDGFSGIHHVDLWHNVLIFDTLNNCKLARNKLKGKGVDVGEVCPLLIKKEYIKG